MLPSVLALGALALVALALPRQSPTKATEELHGAARALFLATVLQACHFAEETAGGFHQRFPALFGLPPIPLAAFVTFNVLMLGIWLVSVRALRQSRPAAFLAAWFLALAGILNLVAHPLLAVVASGYFPGLASSPFVGVAAIHLWRKLRDATKKSPACLD